MKETTRCNLHSVRDFNLFLQYLVCNLRIRAEQKKRRMGDNTVSEALEETADMIEEAYLSEHLYVHR